MKVIISAHNLSFQNKIFYPNINIKQESITFISGPSGTGKSTLLKLINATQISSRGTIHYNNQDIQSLDKVTLRRNVLLIGQIPFLFQGTILDNFQIYHQYHESVCPQIDTIESLLKICCIEKPLNTECETMSGGERQRIFLSIALSFESTVLMLDEPTSALNRELSTQVIQNIINYIKYKKMTLIMVSHDQLLQDKFAEDIIELGE